MTFSRTAIKAEKYITGLAWFMGVSMLLIAAVHIAFLNPDFRLDGGQDTGWILFVGDVPILVMVLA